MRVIPAERRGPRREGHDNALSYASAGTRKIRSKIARLE